MARGGASLEPETLELRIDSLAAGGDGVGRDAHGRVVFVPRTAPGDRVLVRVDDPKPRFARAEIVQILAPGPGRVVPRCAAFDRCGGCTWQHLDYSVQARAKIQIVRDALERIAGLSAADSAVVAWTPSPRAYGYRSRARVLATPEGVGFRGSRSHRVVAVDRCPVLVPALEDALGALSRERRAPRGTGGEGTEWELATDAEGRARVNALDAAPSRREVSTGMDRLSAQSGVFTQIHSELGAQWTRFVADQAERGARALELFAGIGTLSVPLARRFDSLVAVESDAAACSHLRANLGEVGANAAILRARVTPRALTTWLQTHDPEVVVLDPPRSGLGRESSRAIVESKTRRVVYAACDPAPWARDLRVFHRGGFRLAHCAAFDFFPQTAHVETVAVLVRD